MKKGLVLLCLVLFISCAWCKLVLNKRNNVYNQPDIVNVATPDITISSEDHNTVTEEIGSTPEPDIVDEIKTKEYNGLSFEYNAKYEYDENDDRIYIVFEKGVASLTVSFSKIILEDRELDTTIINGAMLSSFAEKQSEIKNDVDINGIISKSTTCIVKNENTPWLNALCLTVPTATGNVTFLYLEGLETTGDHTNTFGEILASIHLIQ